jgi:hypothetical protein
MTREHMVEDQRFAARRTDVLTFESDELTEDVTIAGPLTAAPVRIDNRYRFRLGGEAHRRLPGRLSRILIRIPRASRWRDFSNWFAAK